MGGGEEEEEMERDCWVKSFLSCLFYVLFFKFKKRI